MAKGPAQFGVKWERQTPNGYRVHVVRDAEMEEMLKTDLDIKRGIYQVLVLDGEEVLELFHDFNLTSATARAKALVDKYERMDVPAKNTSNMEDYL